MNQDLEHLRLLSIFHYVVAGIVGLFSCLPCLHLAMGIAMLAGAFEDGHGQPPPIVGLIFVVIAIVMIVLGWAFAFCLYLAGRSLAGRVRYTFCLVMAALATAFMPFGTVLGVFTILVLVRPSVKELFLSPASASPEDGT